MGEAKITLVPVEYVHTVWGNVDKYIADAVAYTYGRFTVADALECVLDKGYSLWVAFDEERIKGAVITNIVQYPRKRFLNMLFCGGEDGFDWKDSMLQMLRHWAYDNNCDGIEATGRSGWQKIFKDDGLTPLWQTFELPVLVEHGLGVANG